MNAESLRTKAESFRKKLLALAGESSVMVEILIEDATLVAMIRYGASHAECLAYINENF